MADLQHHYDDQYDEIAEPEDQIEVVRNKIRNIRRKVVTAYNIYRILLAFDGLYSCIEEKEKKELMQPMIQKVELTQEKENMTAGFVV